MAYWELSQRVGRLFPVENPAVNVFAEQPRGDGLCLTTLAMQRLSATPDAVLKARQKIGLGKVFFFSNFSTYLAKTYQILSHSIRPSRETNATENNKIH